MLPFGGTLIHYWNSVVKEPDEIHGLEIVHLCQCFSTLVTLRCVNLQLFEMKSLNIACILELFLLSNLHYVITTV